ncbi:site-specific integrase [Shewanella avicenniae]|uniref:Site-specific integrase n=1 Tax=Shewanella avicenniae TaxID=2814294 RepID=A0ABX7QV42_9GAMM|nr:DUF3596 domain-containing protein [Shewanella avicenniae]QSX35352.1 site-specific integrase [Shewanella avicenniae]
MGSVNARGDKLYIDFRYCNVRCREQTLLSDTTSNRRKLTKLLNQIDADIRLGCFVYSDYFPESKLNNKFLSQDVQARQKKEELLGCYKTASQQLQGVSSISFAAFSNEWFLENEVRWKASYISSMKIYVFNYLVAEFGHIDIAQISRPDILKYRAKLMQRKEDGTRLSAEFVNHVMTPLRMILREAADRYGFRCQFENIKPLRVERRDVNPFTLEEVMTFLKTVKFDYRNYFAVRFFTGMRTSEIDGLKWQYVDFRLGIIRIRETYVQGKMDTTKTLGSARDIKMSSVVFKVLKEQFELTGKGEFVFCNAEGNPLDKGNIRDRVWKPALKKMGLKYRRPYETRHTAATLWLAAGEAPEWIAHQMGHSNTKMLFETYSRFVPNLTRQDGSAFEMLLSKTGEMKL